MFEFLSSPFALVAIGLAVLAVAIVLLVIWIIALDRRMRGVVDGLETERRKVAEMQMVIGRRNVARGYGSGRSRQGHSPRGPQPTGAVPPAAAQPQQGHAQGAAQADMRGAARADARGEAA